MHSFSVKINLGLVSKLINYVINIHLLRHDSIKMLELEIYRVQNLHLISVCWAKNSSLVCTFNSCLKRYIGTQSF